MTTPQFTQKPELLSAVYHGRGKGVSYTARFACGHVGRGVFPHANARTSHATIRRWVFGMNDQECCSRVCREAREDQS